MKRTPLKRNTKPIERRTPLQRSTKPIRKRAPGRTARKTLSSRYLAWIRTQPCLCEHVCVGIIEAHHQPATGAASEARWNDYRAVPLCTAAHREYHSNREAFGYHGINLERAIARLQQLYKLSTGKEAA